MANVISAIASPIVQLVVGKLALLIQDEFLTLSGFEKDVKTLQDKLKDIQKVIEVAEKGPQRSEQTNLFEELKDATYDAENVLDMLSTEVLLWTEKQQVSTFPSVAPEWFFRFKNRSIVNDINEIMENFASIHKRLFEMDDLLSHVKEASNGKEKEKEGPTSSPVMHPGVVGRVKEKNDTIEMLISDRFSVEGRVCVTPITGMGGVGKTVLAQQVYNDSKLDGHFAVKIWIPVSDSDGVINMSRIFEEIIAACAKDYVPRGSLEAILQHSVQDLKLLIVLDDVWSENLEDWKMLEKGLLKADKGTRVIVTGRTANVFGLSPENVSITHIPLGKLPHEDCLKLLARNAIDGDVSDLESKGVKTVADEIVSKCDGLPLAVEVIGCLLRTKALDTWSDILNNDLAKVEEEFRDEKHRTLFVLKLSFYHLPPELKQCFSFCSIFPKGHEFDVDELVKLWMAHSLIQPSKMAERLEDKGRRYFYRLRVLSFFQQQPESEKYRMHDYLHDLAELVSGKYSYIVKGENPTGKEIDQKIHHVSLICEKVEGATKVINKRKKLRTILMPLYRNSSTNFGETLGKMFQTLKFLRVLDLSSSSISELPKTVVELKLLRYLNLSRTEIKWLPNALCSLQNLQTLKLLDCPGFLGLPKGLSRLINLRHLEIEEAFWKYRCSTQPPNIGRLTSLHNLHKFRVGESKKGCGIEELKNMKYLEGSLHIMELNNAVHAAEASLKDKPRLQVLELEWAVEREIAQLQGRKSDDYDSKVLEDLKPHSSLTELRVYKYCGKGSPSWLREGQPECLKTLVLEGCQNLEALTLGRLLKLEVICIKNMQKLRELPAQLECPSLHTLKISNCPHLIQLPNRIPKLKRMKIKNCSSLKVIPPLIYPETLVLVDNPVLEGFQGNVPVDFHNLGKQIHRCLITNCPKVHGLPAKYYIKCSASINCKLEISECESIYFDQSFPLTQLTIDTCGTNALLKAMEIIREYKFEVINDSVVSFHYLQSLSISNISDLISFPTSWEVKITTLYILACKDLEALFDSEQSCKGSLPCLLNLSICDCPKLSKFPEELPPKLELLVIQSCISLESLGPPYVLKDLTSLADVCIVACPKLQSFPAQGFPSSLQHLRIQDCPELTKKVCKKENGGRGPDWPKIMNIPYLEIEEMHASPPPVFASCSQGLTCFRGL